ncbi:uncharacterized protein JN550_009384 [Neoarthrinium moseri]|uniref:uncharacterized protein n=1 Tax=Neoarthrinium moseri TaxID=1658444 RepID=UPI001FDE1C21|nr:uncharacterized protein JN550_009384 [Neoarthrinium moseri]KAI1863886.1 hypothetical protein JN550_009384 [Neoarthrinium moseri]
MSLPQSTQCCRVINRRVRPSCESVWIPESALASAFEQYCSVSRITSRRNGSNIPGPLENRRRLGKRHMGELNFGHTHSTAPLWDLADAVDLTQWKWKPATRFEVRNATGLLLGRLQSRLRDWCSTIFRVEAAAPADLTLPESPGANVFGNAEQLAKTAIDLFLTHTQSGGTWRANDEFVSFCARLKVLIVEQRVSRAVLSRFVRRLPQEVRSQAKKSGAVPSASDTGVFVSHLYNAVLDGILMSRSLLGYSISHYHPVYSDLLDQTSRLGRIGYNKLALLRRIMSDIPRESVGQFETEIVSNITQLLYVLHQDHAVISQMSLNRRINNIRSCLETLTSNVTAHRAILEKITQRIAKRDIFGFNKLRDTHYLNVRLDWLGLLARLPQVEDNFFGKACSLLEKDKATKACSLLEKDKAPKACSLLEKDKATKPLSQKQLCELFLLRLNRRHVAVDPLTTNETVALHKELRSIPDSQCFAQISSTLWKKGRLAQVKELACFLLDTSRPHDIYYIIGGLEMYARGESKALADLAIRLGDPQLALLVYICYHQSRQTSSDTWRTSFANEIMPTFTALGVNPGMVLDALKVHPVQCPSRSRELSQSRVQRTEMAALAIAHSRRISDRVAFTNVSRCVRFLQSHKHRVTPQVLGALYYVVTRDLEDGRPGRQTRLRWFLQLLSKESDHNNVLKVGMRLKEWRALYRRRKQKRPSVEEEANMH